MRQNNKRGQVLRDLAPFGFAEYSLQMARLKVYYDVMAKRKILILDRPESFWLRYLEEFFEDTPTELCVAHEASGSAGAATLFDSFRPDIVFTNPILLTLPLTQKLKAQRLGAESFRMFSIGDSHITKDIPFDESFDAPPVLVDFQKRLTQVLPMPESIRVLVVDDEPEIFEMVRDFLTERKQPAFEILTVENGAKGLEAISREKPDVIVLDIKMPVMDGREFYRQIKTRGISVPVIVFFDAIAGDEMIEIHKIGCPAVIEKNARLAVMPEMMTLIKKMVYFG